MRASRPVVPTPEEAALLHMPAVAWGAAVALCGVAWVDSRLFDGVEQTVFVAVQLTIAVAMAATAIRLHLGPLGHVALERIVTVLAFAVELSVAARAAASGEAWRELWACLCLLAVANAITDGRRFLAALVVNWAGWAGALLYVGLTRTAGDPLVWIELTFAVALSTVFAVVTRSNRTKVFHGLLQAREDAERQMVTDSLTGVGNRRALHLLAPALMETARREEIDVHCLFVDVDAFKRVNDTYGHEFGDSVLVAVAEALHDATRASDLVIRWAGDEFVLVGLGQGVTPTALEQRVRSRLSAVRPALSDGWTGTVTVGAATRVVTEDLTLEALLHEADLDMYRRRGDRRSGASSGQVLLD